MRPLLYLAVGRGLYFAPLTTYYFLGEIFALPRDNSRVARGTAFLPCSRSVCQEKMTLVIIKHDHCHCFR